MFHGNRFTEKLREVPADLLLMFLYETLCDECPYQQAVSGRLAGHLPPGGAVFMCYYRNKTARWDTGDYCSIVSGWSATKSILYHGGSLLAVCLYPTLLIVVYKRSRCSPANYSLAWSVSAQMDDNSRSLAAALQSINGMSSVLSLIPVLTGKTQNVKAIAARVFPCSLAVAGLGAGRVLSKLQIGLMLLSADLYRNLVGDLSYYHHEYVNTFSPSLINVPSGTPERHTTNTIVNHNPTEDYMVEAWFRTQGLPATVELSQTNNRRVFCGILVYLLLYAFETFLAVQNAATGTALALIVLQTISGACWLGAICVLQAARGQGKRHIHLNRLGTSEYRCYQLALSGQHVRSAVLSTQLSNIREYNLFDSKYESGRLRMVGGAMVASGTIDIFATVLVVGLNEWAYGWLALEVVFVAVKVFFSLEPIRRVPIVDVQAMPNSGSGDPGPSSLQRSLSSTRLPIAVNSDPDFSFVEVCVARNIVDDVRTSRVWRSRTPGLYIGQPYHSIDDTTTSQLPAMRRPVDGKPAPSKEPLRPSSSFPMQDSISEKENPSPTSDTACPLAALPLPLIAVQSPSPSVEEPLPSGALVAASSLTTASPAPITKTTSCPSPTTAVVLLDRHETLSLRSLPNSRVAITGGRKVHHNAVATGTAPDAFNHDSLSEAPPAAREAALAPPQRPPSQVSLAPPPLPKSPRTLPRYKLNPPTQVIAQPSVRYLTVKDGLLTLSEKQPAAEVNQALQREFLACLAEVVRSNKVASIEFLRAVEAMRDGIHSTMSDNWYAFGTTDLSRYLRTARQDVLWRLFL
ncbi:hypothetical protein C8Q79DRAFT_603365 [Trametes meyenii]|nr:hypothetical protein C8Q79DRAFT_603365 [Trametes meyenii]